MSSANCLSCKKPNARLGTAPHKYCYRVNCISVGESRGHIKRRITKVAAAVAPGAATMERDEDRSAPPSIFGDGKIQEIVVMYGSR
jgi:hypothetical protein